MKSRCFKSVLSFLGTIVLVFSAMKIASCGTAPKKNSVPKSDEELEAANRLAQFAFENGKYEQAAVIYRRALEHAYVRDDAVAILDARYNLAVCLMELETYLEALTILDQAKEEMAFKDAQLPPEIYLLEATIYYRGGRLDDSWRTTEEILATRNIVSPLIYSKTYFIRGLVSSHRDDVAGMQKAIDKMGQPQNATVKSDLSELSGRLAMAENKWDQAIRLFDEATVVRRENSDYRRMAMTQALSAEANEKAGKTGAAASRYLQAGRSAALRGDLSNAHAWLAQAARLFQQIGNDTLAAESRSLIIEISGKSP